MARPKGLSEAERKAGRAAYMRAYYAKNRDRLLPQIKAAAARWVAKNPEKRRAVARAYQKRRRKELLEQMTPMELRRFKAAEKCRLAAWVAENRDHVNAMSAARNRRYYAADPEKFIEVQHRRRALTKKGKVSAADWRAILERYGHRCAYCRAGGVKLERDHVRPITKGGPHRPANIVPACRSCNARKGNRTGVRKPRPVTV